MAHAGVLEVLTEAGIPIQCVAGTSAGAMVGAAFAAGQLMAFRAVMCSLTRRRVFWLFDPTWPRTGLLEGRRPLELIQPYVGERIESLPLTYAAVATDLRSGEEVVLRQGSVAAAIRASAAVPGILTPERWEGRLLVDGGLVNPLPIDVARQLGAEVVIAVSVLSLAQDTPPRASDSGRSSLTSQWLARAFARGGNRQAQGVEKSVTPALRAPEGDGDLGLIDIISRSTSLVQARIAASMLRAQPPDCLISVPLPHIGLFDFHRSSEAIEAGRRAAEEALPAIRDALARHESPGVRFSRWLNSKG